MGAVSRRAEPTAAAGRLPGRLSAKPYGVWLGPTQIIRLDVPGVNVNFLTTVATRSLGPADSEDERGTDIILC